MSNKNAPTKKQFTRELRLMMYGFGDDGNPRPDTVDMMEEIVLEYLHKLCTEANELAKHTNTKVKIEDFLFVLRKDAKKLARAEELLFRFDELLKARKAFDVA